MKTALPLLLLLYLATGRLLAAEEAAHTSLPLGLNDLRIPQITPEQLAHSGHRIPPGAIVRQSDDPRRLWIGTPPAYPPMPINPDPEALALWANYPAVAPLAMLGQPLVFDQRYRLAGDGTRVTLSATGTPLIRVFGGSLYVRILSIRHHAPDDTLILEIDTGSPNLTPTVEYSLDLTANPQVWTEVEDYSLTPAVSGDDGRVTAVIPRHQGSPLNHAPFYRISVPSADAARIELLATTAITGDLTVSGSLNAIRLAPAPATHDAPAPRPGIIIWDEDKPAHLYISTSDSSWGRVPIETLWTHD